MSNPLRFPSDALQQLCAAVRDFPLVAGVPRSVALTSAVQDEGVSSAALALASSLASQQRLRVLLVDANLRRPSLHLLCDVARSAGLSELVSSAGSWLNQGRQVADNFKVLGAGAAVDNPSSYLATSVLSAGMQSLVDEVDWVIFDCPPVNSCAEASMIAAACDATVLVVPSGRTRREVAQDAKRRLEQGSAHLAGAVLNRRRYYIPEALYRWL